MAKGAESYFAHRARDRFSRDLRNCKMASGLREEAATISVGGCDRSRWRELPGGAIQ